ncbi:MAG: head-tail connector protein [Parvibaculaceae bacterium]
MSLTLIDPPVAEPVTLAEAKVFLRLDGSEEDALVDRLIAAARAHVERETGLALLTQRWTQTLDRWPDDAVPLGIWPVSAVEQVAVKDALGSPAEVDAESYVADLAGRPARLLRPGGWPEPGLEMGGIAITFEAGFGDERDDVPADLRQALLMLVAHWFERRTGLEEALREKSPPAVAALVRPFRLVRV